MSLDVLPASADARLYHPILAFYPFPIKLPPLPLNILDLKTGGEEKEKEKDRRV